VVDLRRRRDRRPAAVRASIITHLGGRRALVRVRPTSSSWRCRSLV
jgi:hypothetical protein